jgi:hypothetical protein
MTLRNIDLSPSYTASKPGRSYPPKLLLRELLSQHNAISCNSWTPLNMATYGSYVHVRLYEETS